MGRLWVLASLLAGMIGAGCGETKVLVQDALKGTWKLSARTESDGSKVPSPELSGVLQWYAVNDRVGHLTVVLLDRSAGGKVLSLESGKVDIDPEKASLERELLMGTSYLAGDGPADADLSPKKLTARVTISPPVTRLALDNGTRMSFQATRLTVEVPGRYTDTWQKE